MNRVLRCFIGQWIYAALVWVGAFGCCIAALNFKNQKKKEAANEKGEEDGKEQAVLANFAELYFRNALMAGTPFTQEGARELRRLGILTMVIPTGCAVLAEIVQGILTGFMNVSVDGWMEFNFDNESSVVVGVMLIVGSFVCGYGDEMLNQKKVSQE